MYIRSSKSGVSAQFGSSAPPPCPAKAKAGCLQRGALFLARPSEFSGFDGWASLFVL